MDPVDTLMALLTKPEWSHCGKSWRRLTRGTVLFDSLLGVVQARRPCDWEKVASLVRSWRDKYVQPEGYPGRPADLARWGIVRRLTWCAAQAATRPQAYAGEIDRIFFAWGTDEQFLPEYDEQLAQAEQDRLWGWTRTFLGVTRRGEAVRIPVALYDEATDKGFLADLELEVLEGGAGEVFRHPVDAFTPGPGPGLIASLRDAWGAARGLARRDGDQDSRYGGRFRLLRDGRPLTDAKGRSASGAATWGWYHALRCQVPDERIIVIGQVLSNAGERDEYQLDGVDEVGLRAKIPAVAESGRFDTIVLANDENQSIVASCLRELGNDGKQSPEVVSLDQLMTVRSRLAMEVLAYLDDLAARAAKLPAYFPAHLRGDGPDHAFFDAVRQMVEVVEDRTAWDQWQAQRHERERTAGQYFEGEAYAPRRSRLEAGDSRSDPIPEPPKIIPWDERAGSRFRRAVILGDPGFGKSWLLNYETRRLASRSSQLLSDRTVGLNQLVLPILAPLSVLNRSDGLLEDALVGWAGKVGWEGKDPIDAFCQFVHSTLASDRGVVLLDAWDEVRVEVPQTGQPIAFLPQNRQRLGQRLADFADADKFRGCRMLMTSRIVGYRSASSLGPPIPHAQELELIAFDSPQVEAFARVWFGRDQDAAAWFLEWLHQAPQVRGLARIPLMCRIFAERAKQNLAERAKQNLPTRRVELYERCLRGLLRDWKKEEGEIGPAWVDGMLEMLEEVAYRLLSRGLEQFGEDELPEPLTAWLNGLKPSHALHGSNPDVLIADLKRDGIVIRTGEGRDAPLMFLHRTFQEYLAARALARRARSCKWRSIAKEVNRRAWLPSWQEVLSLLAGLLDEPRPLIKLLADGRRDDYFRHRLALATRVLTELSPEQLERLSSLTRRVVTGTLTSWMGFVVSGAEDAVAHLRRAILTLGRLDWQAQDREFLRDWLLRLLDSEKTQRSVVNTVGLMGAAAPPEVVARLAKLAGDSDTNDEIRSDAISALGQLGAAAPPEVVARLAELAGDRSADVDIRGDATLALCRLGAKAPAEAVTRYIEHLNVGGYNRSSARDIKRFLEGLGAEDHRQLIRKNEASDASFWAFGGVHIISPAVGTDRRFSVQNGAAIALGQLGTAAPPEVVARLVELAGDGTYAVSSDVRIQATVALCLMGAATSQDIGLLVEFTAGFARGDTLYQQDVPIVIAAIDAMGRLGTAAPPEVVARLIEFTYLQRTFDNEFTRWNDLGIQVDDDEDIQSAAALAIGHLGAAVTGGAVNRLFALTNRPIGSDVHVASFEAIGRLVKAMPNAARILSQLLRDRRGGLRGVKRSTQLGAAMLLSHLGAAAPPEAVVLLCNKLVSRKYDSSCGLTKSQLGRSLSRLMESGARAFAVARWRRVPLLTKRWHVRSVDDLGHLTHRRSRS